MRFIWDHGNLTHIARHGLSTEEVEHALSGFTLEVEYQEWHDEERYAEVGITAAGRMLLVVSTWRDSAIRVVTAYDAPKRLVEEYFKKR